MVMRITTTSPVMAWLIIAAILALPAAVFLGFLRADRCSMKREEVPFDEWCVIELMGHKQIAGRVTAQAIGNSTLIRVDVPGDEGAQAITKLFGDAAIFSMTVCDKAVVIKWLEQNGIEAIPQFNMKSLRIEATRHFIGADDGPF
jgi:hypothetical protein